MSKGKRRLGASVDRFRTVTVASGPTSGFRLDVRYSSNDYRSGTVELPVQLALASLLRPGDVFFDVGANIGFFTLLASRSVGPRGSLYAFEARPDIARAAETNLRRNGVLGTVLSVAVGDSDGTVPLLIAAHPGGSTIEPSMAVDTVRTLMVEQVSVDSLLSSGLVPPPNVVKIDVEGAERAVLRGMSDTLKWHQPTLVFELDDADEARLESQYAEIRDQLADSGYRCERLAASYIDIGWHVMHAVARPVLDESRSIS